MNVVKQAVRIPFSERVSRGFPSPLVERGAIALRWRGEENVHFVSSPPTPLRQRRGEMCAPNVGEEIINFKKTAFMLTPLQAARELRQKMTAEEKMLWQTLRAHKFKGYKFRRQHPIVYQVFEKSSSFYVADFYCAAGKIVIELDGKHHEFTDQKEYDKARDKLMAEFGMKILRIKNDELKDMNNVLEKIEALL